MKFAFLILFLFSTLGLAATRRPCGPSSYAGLISRHELSERRRNIRAQMRALSARIASGNLPKEERLRRTKEIADSLAAELRSQGFQAQAYLAEHPNGLPEDNAWRVRLIRSPLDSAPSIFRAEQKWDIDFYFMPYSQAAIPGSLGGSIWHAEVGIVMLPIESILAKNVGLNLHLLHEIYHIKDLVGLLQKKPGPYYGLFTATAEEPGINLPGYSHFFSLSELGAHHRDMRQSIAGLQAMKPLLLSKNEVDISTSERAFQLYALSKETQKLVMLSREGMDQAAFSIDEQVGCVVADLPIFSQGKKLGEMRYWLVDSGQAGNRGKNLALLQQYLDTVNNKAAFHLNEALQVLQKYGPPKRPTK